MLTHHRDFLYQITPSDQLIYDRVLPRDSKLLDMLDCIDWNSFETHLAPFYVKNKGQPSYPPLILFKIEFLRYLYNLSDRQVIERCWTDLQFRYFLQMGIVAKLPDPSSLTRFRGRLGVEGFTRLFDELVKQARDAGLVQDRLRLKDASHVIANIAVPSTLGLLAQLRDRMLAAIEAVDHEIAEGFRVALQLARESTAQADDESKLQEGLNLVTSMLLWIQSQARSGPEAQTLAWLKLQSVKELAQKIIGECTQPGQGDRTLSAVDPDARCGKHGDFYDGYMLDILMDSDSELITSVEVLPANADEAANAIALIEHEHQTHGNQVGELSIDGIGFNGKVLNQLQDPAGVNVEVTVPTRDFTTTVGFPASDFEYVEEGTRVRCPAGELSRRGSTKSDKPNVTTFQFSGKKCQSCPLLLQCHPEKKEGSRTGRRVSKNRYEAEYERARAKAKTPHYDAIRKEHPRIERKLNELIRHHRCRHARYWGRAKVTIQGLMTALAVNAKRITKLMFSSPPAPALATS